MQYMTWRATYTSPVARHFFQRISNPRLLSPMTSYEVASYIWQACHPTHFEPWFIEFNAILWRGKLYLAGPVIRRIV